MPVLHGLVSVDKESKNSRLFDPHLNKTFARINKRTLTGIPILISFSLNNSDLAQQVD